MTDRDDAFGPDQFAALVRDASDEQLEAGIAANRDVLIGEIFRRMPESLDPERTRDVDAVAEWEILAGPGGGPDRFQVAIRYGSCTVTRDGEDNPDVRYQIGALDFVKMVGGAVQPPALFVFGKLKVRGDLMLAARMTRFFRVPGR
jgi:hypothetical protein